MNLRLSNFHQDEGISHQAGARQTRFSESAAASSSSAVLFCDQGGWTKVWFHLDQAKASREITACSSLKYYGQEGEFEIQADAFARMDTPLGVLTTTSLRFDLFADPFTLTFAIPPCHPRGAPLTPDAVLIPRDQPVGCLVQRGLEHNFVILEPSERVSTFLQLTGSPASPS